MKRATLCMGLALAIVALASVAFAAENAITINGGGQTVLMKAPSVKVNQPYRHDPKLKTIYTNLGTGNDVYQSGTGWTISGSGSVVGELWTQGCAFKPKANHTITKIEVGFTYVTGDPNSGTISLYSDKGGQPNKVIHNFPAVSNLPTFGDTGSVLQTVKDTKGIKVKKGTQYWLVLSAPDDTWDVWNLANTATGNEAYNNGNGWTVRSVNLGAFAVLGK